MFDVMDFKILERIDVAKDKKWNFIQILSKFLLRVLTFYVSGMILMTIYAESFFIVKFKFLTSN